QLYNGLAPYFQSALCDKVSQCDVFVAFFDEALNNLRVFCLSLHVYKTMIKSSSIPNLGLPLGLLPSIRPSITSFTYSDNNDILPVRPVRMITTGRGVSAVLPSEFCLFSLTSSLAQSNPSTPPSDSSRIS